MQFSFRFFTQVWKHRRSYFLAMVVSLGTLAQASRCQNNVRISGVVLDAIGGQPVSFAVVEVSGTGYSTHTDDRGLFLIENLSPGQYQFQVHRFGYQAYRSPVYTVQQDVPLKLEIRLQPEAWVLDSIRVEARPARFTSDLQGEKVILSGEILRQYQQLGLDALLQQVAGLQVEKSGSAGQSRVRMHGGRANQVMVMLDGQVLSNPQTGEVDLQTIPLEEIERVEIIRQGNSAAFGGNALNGVIAFYTRQNPGERQMRMTAGAGSFETADGRFQFAYGNTAWQLNGLIFQNYSRQNFPYHYEGRSFVRENAWYRGRGLFTKLTGKLSKVTIRLLLQRRWNRQGLPSAYFNELKTFGAFLDERIDINQVQLELPAFNNSRFSFQAARQALWQRFDNHRDPSPFTRYLTRQTNQIQQIQGIWQRFSPRWELVIGAQHLTEEMDHQNELYPPLEMGRQRRTRRGVWVSGGYRLKIKPLLIQELQVRGSLRYEKYFEAPGNFFPSLGGTLRPSFFPHLAVSPGWAHSIRYPDFNSLFWKGDSRAEGNPHLLPEENRTRYLRLRWEPSESRAALEIYLFQEKYRNLIFWHRGVNGVWQPRNLQQAHKKGVDITLLAHLWENHLEGQITYSRVEAINRSGEPTTDGKRIVFTPQHTLQPSLWINFSGFSGHLSYRYVSERETVPANSRGTQLPAYGIWDGWVGYRYQLGQLVIQCDLQLKNIFETDYQLIYGYPMPGREWFLKVSIEFNANKRRSS